MLPPEPMEHPSFVILMNLEFLNTSMSVKVQSQDISVAHRLKAGPRDKTRPLIVRFVNRKVRNEVHRSKKKLKDIPSNEIYISEHLNKSTSDLFYSARKMVKRIAAAWTQNGQV